LKKYATYTLKDFVTDGFFLEHACSPTEETHLLWNSFKSNYPHRVPVFNEALRTVKVLGLTKNVRDNKALIEVWGNLSTAMANADRRSQRLSRRKNLGKFSKYAAALLALFGFATMWYWVQDTPEPSTRLFEIATGFGENKTVVLPDGSVIQLNGNTSMKYNSGWEVSPKREVWLNGEAFFDVAHVENKEFIVHSANMNIKVKGTSFNFMSREDKATVLLKEGKVLLDVIPADTTNIVLEPGYGFSYSKKEEALELSHKKVDVKALTSWKEDKLIFDNTQLEIIDETLRDNYGLRIHYNPNASPSMGFTGEFSSYHIDPLLSALKKSFDIDIVEL